MIHYMEFPTIGRIKQLCDEIPQYEQVISILEKELEAGNVILNIGNAGTLPDETVVNIQFQEEPAEEYFGLKDYGTPYKRLFFSDNHGCTYIWFGLKKRI